MIIVNDGDSEQLVKLELSLLALLRFRPYHPLPVQIYQVCCLCSSAPVSRLFKKPCCLVVILLAEEAAPVPETSILVALVTLTYIEYHLLRQYIDGPLSNVLFI